MSEVEAENTSGQRTQGPSWEGTIKGCESQRPWISEPGFSGVGSAHWQPGWADKKQELSVIIPWVFPCWPAVSVFTSLPSGSPLWFPGCGLESSTLIPSHVFSLAFSPWVITYLDLWSPTRGFPGGSCNAGDLGSIPGSRRSLEKEMATHSSILAWEIPWMKEPGGLQSKGSQRVGHDWATSLSLSPTIPYVPSGQSEIFYTLCSQTWHRTLHVVDSQCVCST